PVRSLAPARPDHREGAADGPARDRGSGEHLRERGALPGRGAPETACRAADAGRECAAGEGDSLRARSGHRTGRIVDLGLPRLVGALGLLSPTPPGLRRGGQALPALRRSAPRGGSHGALDVLLRPLPALRPRRAGRGKPRRLLGNSLTRRGVVCYRAPPTTAR